MKKILIVWSWLMLIGLGACSDWIDVRPKTDVKSDDLFKTEDGFKSALIGVYGRMTKVETYGGHLTFDYIEKLVQRYDNYELSNTPSQEERAKIYDYVNDSDTKGNFGTIWENMYRTIANINNLLANIERNGHVLTTEGLRDMMKGEALALRAFHYFDLLRLWGPIFSVDPEAKSIPWRDQFTADKVPLMPANEVAEKILEDLAAADSLLKNDPLNYGADVSQPFFGDRKHHMNKYAVKALMARVYLYIGNKEKAAEYALEVIKNCGMKLAKDNSKDVSLYEESLFALNMYDMDDKLAGFWKNSPTSLTTELWISINNARDVFELNTGIGVNDMRYLSGKGFLHGASRVICRKYLGEELLYKEKVPLIRLAEMYYIAAESLPLQEGVFYLNEVRNARGISRKNNIQYGPGFTEESMVNALDLEYSKEFFAEGQYFYFLKRHDRKTFYRCPVGTMRYYVLPIPNDEVEFGNVTE